MENNNSMLKHHITLQRKCECTVINVGSCEPYNYLGASQDVMTMVTHKKEHSEEDNVASLNTTYWCGSTKTEHNLDERLQRVKPLRYPPANLIRGKLSFTGVVSVFHPQGRNVNDVANEGKS